MFKVAAVAVLLAATCHCIEFRVAVRNDELSCFTEYIGILCSIVRRVHSIPS